MIRTTDKVLLNFKTVISMETALDALDWCTLHKSKGKFSFTWQFKREGRLSAQSIQGLFQFTRREDYMQFVLRWT